MSRARPATTASASRPSGPVKVTGNPTTTVKLAAKQRDARGAAARRAAAPAPRNVDVDIKGPNGLDAGAALRARRQGRRRRCWRGARCRTLAKGESLTLTSDMFADLVPGTGGVSLSVGLSTALDAATLLKALDRYPYRLLRADHQPRDAAALCQRARGRRASGDGHRRRPAHPGRDRPAAGAAGLERLVRPVVGRRRRRLARRLRHRLPDARAREGLRGAGRRCSSSRSTSCATPSSTPTEPAKDGGRDLAYALYVLARNGAAPIGDLRYLADTKLDDARDADRQGAARRGARAARRPGRAPSASMRRRCDASRRSRCSSSAAPITARRCATRRRW